MLKKRGAKSASKCIKTYYLLFLLDQFLLLDQFPKALSADLSGINA